MKVINFFLGDLMMIHTPTHICVCVCVFQDKKSVTYCAASLGIHFVGSSSYIAFFWFEWQRNSLAWFLSFSTVGFVLESREKLDVMSV